MSTTRGYEPLTPQGAATAGIGGRLLGCGCCCCISVVFAIYAVALGYVTIEVNKEFVEMPGGRTDKYCRFGEDAVSPLNVTFSIWWPGCGRVSSMDNFSTGCGEPCYDEQTMIDMQEMMSTLPFKKVRYSSRPNDNWDTVELGGWWLPADEEKFPSPRPRMVVQHGFTSNSNKARQMFVAYILRSIGFDVLVNNFRDHCLSGDSKLKFYQWGYAYPYDTLGAWDYAKDDPDGLLGGAVGASQVGILGFSKGGFNTLNAFGLEGEVPGAWVDGAVHEPFEVLEFGVEEELSSMGRMGIGFLAPVLVWPAWQLTLLRYKIQYGADLELHRPINTLPKGPDTKRPIHLTQNVNDDTVPQFQSEENVALLESLPEKYEIKGYWKTSEVCNGVSHCVDHITVREEYKQRLCDFWGEVFDYDGCVEAAKAPAKEVKKPEQPEKVDERRLKLTNIQV